MVWRYGGEGATHKIWPGSIQRFPRNLSLRTTDGRTDGRTTDACAMTVALLTKSSRAKIETELAKAVARERVFSAKKLGTRTRQNETRAWRSQCHE